MNNPDAQYNNTYMNDQAQSDYDQEDDDTYQNNVFQNKMNEEPIDDQKEAKVTNEFLFEWFQKFHYKHHVLKSIYKFNKNDCLFNERYMAMLMHLAVPQEFESVIQLENSSESNSQMLQCFDEMSEIEIRKLWAESYEKADNRSLNLQFLSSLKQFFREKGLDFTPILKNIFQAFQTKEKAVSTEQWENAYWQLAQMIFTGLYIESSPGNENMFIKDFFEIEIKVDVLLLRMVLDIVSKCLKLVEPSNEAFENSQFLNQSQKFDRNSILGAIDQVGKESQDFSGFGGITGSSPQQLINNFQTQKNRQSNMFQSPRDTEYESSRSSQRGLFQRQTGDSSMLLASSSRGKNNYSFKIDVNASLKSRQQLQEEQYQEEEDEHIMSQDHTKWDIFRDAKLIEKREAIIEKRKKKKIQEELNLLRSDREMKNEMNDNEQLNFQIKRLKDKIDQKDQIIQKKQEREDELLKEIQKKDKTIQQKDEKIKDLNKNSYQLEVIQEKFEQKQIEIEGLIMRLGEMANENEQLRDDVQIYDQKLIKKSKYIDELKERQRHQKEQIEEMELSNQKSIQRYERQISLLQAQRDQILEKSKNQDGEPIVDIVINDDDIRHFDLDQSMNSQLDQNAKDGQNQPETLDDDLKNVEDIDDINFNENMFNNNNGGSPYNRSILRSSHQGSFVNDYVDNQQYIINDQSNNINKDYVDEEDYNKDGQSYYQDGNKLDTTQQNQQYSPLNDSYRLEQTDFKLLDLDQMNQLQEPILQAKNLQEQQENVQLNNDKSVLNSKKNHQSKTSIYESDEEIQESNNFKQHFNIGKNLKNLFQSQLGSPNKFIELQNFRRSLSPSNKDSRITLREMGYAEIEEKFQHYKKTSERYEKLYGEYLEKFILSERDKQLLIHRQRRVNSLIKNIAHYQALWDQMSIFKRSMAIIFITFLVSLIVILCLLAIFQ